MIQGFGEGLKPWVQCHALVQGYLVVKCELLFHIGSSGDIRTWQGVTMTSLIKLGENTRNPSPNDVMEILSKKSCITCIFSVKIYNSGGFNTHIHREIIVYASSRLLKKIQSLFSIDRGYDWKNLVQTKPLVLYTQSGCPSNLHPRTYTTLKANKPNFTHWTSMGPYLEQSLCLP